MALQRGTEDEGETSLDEIYEIDEIDEVDEASDRGAPPRERLLREGACLPTLLRALGSNPNRNSRG